MKLILGLTVQVLTAVIRCKLLEGFLIMLAHPDIINLYDLADPSARIAEARRFSKNSSEYLYKLCMKIKITETYVSLLEGVDLVRPIIIPSNFQNRSIRLQNNIDFLPVETLVATADVSITIRDTCTKQLYDVIRNMSFIQCLLLPYSSVLIVDGHDENYFFVLKRETQSNGEMKFVLLLVEESPIVDSSSINNQMKLESLFLMSHDQVMNLKDEDFKLITKMQDQGESLEDVLLPSDRMNLCKYTPFMKFRICSELHSVWRPESHPVLKWNTIRRAETLCVTSPIVVLEMTPHIYRFQSAIDMISCTVNQDEDAQFFVTVDATSENAVFVLEANDLVPNGYPTFSIKFRAKGVNEVNVQGPPKIIERQFL